jgi:hypothetical protein
MLQTTLNSDGFFGITEAMENEYAQIKEDMAEAFFISNST